MDKTTETQHENSVSLIPKLSLCACCCFQKFEGATKSLAVTGPLDIFLFKMLTNMAVGRETHKTDSPVRNQTLRY